MARLRTIKPGFFTNEVLAEISLAGRVLFAGLWCQADREGRLEDRPRRLKVEILPFDDYDVDSLLNDLAVRGFIQRYEVAGCRYIAVTNFAKHQTPHIREAKSTIPAPDAPGASTIPAPLGSGEWDRGSGDLDLGSENLDPDAVVVADGEANPAPAPVRETPPPADLSSEPEPATNGRAPSPHAAADALTDAMVEGLRDAKKAGTLTVKTTAGLRRRERPVAQRLVRDGWTPPDIRACTRFLASIYATVDMLLVERQIDTWEVNGRPETKQAAMPARAAPAAPAVAPNGKLATILGGLAAYGEQVDDDGSVSAGDGSPLPDLATPGAGSSHGRGTQRYLPPGAGGPDG